MVNNFDVIKKLFNMYVWFDDSLVSFDVVSFFYVSINFVTDILEEKWDYIGEKANLPKSEFILIFYSNLHYSFSGNFYEQTFGPSMCSPFSLVIAALRYKD